MADRSFWRGRKVFVTGHTGFKGSWLTLWLNAMGAEVTGYALNPPTEPNLFTQANVADCAKWFRADIRDYGALMTAIATCKPDVVIHMAAQSVVRAGYDNPIETYSTNVMGTVNLFEAIRQLKHPCVVVNVTSDKCYQNKEWVWGYRETEPMGGRDPYSNSKGCAELVTTAYRESFFLPAKFEQHGVALASARAGNAIGGGDWTSNQLIPDLIRAFLADRPCPIRSPASIRPWQFVLEPLNGYLMLAEYLAMGARRFDAPGGWNFGPVDADARPVSWVADEMVKSWNQFALTGCVKWIRDDGDHPHEANYLKLDASMAKAHLKWQPRLPLQQALEWIVEWYRGHQAGNDIRLLTMSQIERYEQLLTQG